MSMVFDDLPALRTGEFGLWDLNLGYLLPALEASWEFVALPVFSKRKSTLQFIFCRDGIASPKDLEGKRVASSSYRTALTVWARGLLRERYGVDVNSMRWLVWRDEHLPLHDVHTVVERNAGPATSPVDAFLAGEADVLITDVSEARIFRQLEQDSSVHRLFPDYEAEDERLYAATGIYTPVHIIVMSRKVDQQHPGLARRLYDAFEEAKRLAEDDALSDRGGFSVLYQRERLLEQKERWGDPFKHGIEANRSTLDAYLKYNVDQGMIGRAMDLKEIFAASTLDT